MSTCASTSTIMNEMLVFLQGVAMFVRCNRRKQAPAQSAAILQAGLFSAAVSQSSAKAAASVESCSNDSMDDVDTSAGSTDSSDTESSSVEVSGFVDGIGPPPGLIAPPPGLESLMPVPGIDSQARWTHLPNQQGECSTHGAPPSLHDVVNKLSPQDAATVMAAINAVSANKLQSQSLAEMSPFGTQLNQYGDSMEAPRVVGLQRPANAGLDGRWAPKQRTAPRPWTPSHQAPRAHNDVAARSHNVKSRDAPRAPASAKPADGSNGCSLRDNLAQLSHLDQKCVILVRKINKLGLNSPQLLETYFSRFGPVQNVYVTHSIEKTQGGRFRTRPAGLGFVAMNNAHDAAAALQGGSEHLVLGVPIFAGPYEDHRAAQALKEE